MDLPQVIHKETHMPERIILASGSQTRANLLAAAGVTFQTDIPRVDEDSVKAAMLEDGAPPRDIADKLAELKAHKVAGRHGEALVIGCDQVGAVKGRLLGKPTTPDDARDQLRAMRGERHSLISAVVIVENGQPVWRHVGVVRLQVRDFSDAFLDGYIERNWESIRHSAGCYKLEEEGVRLFSRIEGDYFTVLGLPLVELLSYLMLRGELQA